MRVKPTIARQCAQCGDEFPARIDHIRNGNGKFCGRSCYYLSKRVHGEGGSRYSTAEYRAWSSMRKRCRPDPKSIWFKYYAERGITVFPEWELSYEAFLRDVGRKPSPEYSLDRVDNDRGYEPGNVRWATPSEQSRNRRSVHI